MSERLTFEQEPKKQRKPEALLTKEADDASQQRVEIAAVSRNNRLLLCGLRFSEEGCELPQQYLQETDVGMRFLRCI